MIEQEKLDSDNTVNPRLFKLFEWSFRGLSLMCIVIALINSFSFLRDTYLFEFYQVVYFTIVGTFFGIISYNLKHPLLHKTIKLCDLAVQIFLPTFSIRNKVIVWFVRAFCSMFYCFVLSFLLAGIFIDPRYVQGSISAAGESVFLVFQMILAVPLFVSFPGLLNQIRKRNTVGWKNIILFLMLFGLLILNILFLSILVR